MMKKEIQDGADTQSIQFGGEILTMKKKMITGILAAVMLAAGATDLESELNPPPREIKIGKEMSTLISSGNGDLEIVVPPEAGDTARYAGEELQHFLQKGCGVEIPLRETRSNAKYAIILGDNTLFRNAFPGKKLEKLVRDGFYTLREKGDIYIAGRDDKGKQIRKFLSSRSGDWRNDPYFERGTLFGTYDFLERFAGVRFFFDGEIGTVVPRHKEWKVPDFIHIMDRPDFTSRKTSWWIRNKDEWYNNDDPIAASNRNYLRWRLESRTIPNCHGLAYLGYVYRFGKTHPEYFALRKDGTRYSDPKLPFPGQLCLSNPDLRNEIFLDVRSFLKGEAASVRGIMAPGKASYWASPGFQKGFANIMPQDAFQECLCEKCRKYFDRGEKGGSNLVWEMTAEIANRLKKEKIPGFLTQMAYHFYSVVPDVDVPDNVLVMLAVRGPWREGKPQQTKDDEKLRGWRRKVQNKIAFWNYCINFSKNSERYGYPGMPHTTPRTIGLYYQKRKDNFYGGFLECEADHFIWGVPNIYIASRIFWNADQNVDALLNDFYDKMFAAAAPEMKAFFETVEKNWVDNYQEVDTPLGPQNIPLTQFTIWTKIYPQEEIRRLEGFFDRAEQKVRSDGDALKRVQFFRARFLDVMKQHSAAYQKEQNNMSEILLRALKRTAVPSLEKEIRIPGKTAYLRALKAERTDLSLQVIAQKDDHNLYFLLRFQEPEMKRLKVSCREDAKKKFWEEALAEFFLNPSCDRRNYYQIAVHPSGCFKALAHPSQTPWKADFSVRTHIGTDYWSAEITIPRTALPGMKKEFPFNIAYNRQMVNEEMYSRSYSWSPYITGNFHSIGKYGLLSLDDGEGENLVRDWNFDTDLKGNYLGKWYVKYPEENDFSGFLEPDPSSFISGGQSLHIGMNAGKVVSAGQNLILKPGTRYQFSYWIRHKIATNSRLSAVVFAGRNFFMPEVPIQGNAPWHRKTFTFTTPDHFNGQASVRFFIEKPGAEAWIDNVRIEEQK